MSLGVDVTRTERGLIGSIVRMVMRMSERLSSRAVSARRGVQSIVRPGDRTLIEASRRHLVNGVVKSLLLEDISRLLGESLSKERVGGDLGSVALITGKHVILALN